MKFSNNPKRALILIVSALSFLAIAAAVTYYKYDNKSVDPRIIDARELYSRYDGYTQENNFKAIFHLLDSIENVYSSIKHYSNSFEMGVLYNNRAATYLSMALYFDSNSLSLDGINALSKDSLLILSEMECNKSIKIYNDWIHTYKEKSDTELSELIESVFFEEFDYHSPNEKKRYLKKRISELLEAQTETPRRLSVAYTNLGIVKRHLEKYEEAVDYYKMAMELWDRNLAAENNLNILLGKPLKKQNMLEKLFPPDKSN